MWNNGARLPAESRPYRFFASVKIAGLAALAAVSTRSGATIWDYLRVTLTLPVFDTEPLVAVTVMV